MNLNGLNQCVSINRFQTARLEKAYLIKKNILNMKPNDPS